MVRSARAVSLARGERRRLNSLVKIEGQGQKPAKPKD